MKRYVKFGLVCFLCLSMITSRAVAGEVDILLQKLVEKGILTAGEAQQVGTETKEQVKKELAENKNEIMPAWIQNIKLKGDFRTRFQHEIRKGSNLNLGQTTDRNRGRIRLRLGAEAKVVDNVKVYLGFATGSDSDPRSTNQTFQDSFAKKSIWLDYAYGEYVPFSWMAFNIGRMKNPIWEPGDMLWDKDINPEGAAILFSKKFGTKLEAYMNNAVFVLGENANASDPWMLVLQPGLKYSFSDDIKLNLALAYYGFKQLQGYIPTANSFSAGSNTRNGKSGLTYNYNSLNPSFQLGIINPFKQIGVTLPFGLDIPYLSFFTELQDNLSTDNSHTGYQGGMIIGYEKVADNGQWQILYDYTMLGTDAFPDMFPDSDRYGGRTGVRSHNVRYSYGLSKNWSLGANYWRSDLTSVDPDALGATSKVENLFMAEVNFKF